MNATKESLKKAVHTLLNDVIEQGYRHMVLYPQENDALNRLVNEANESIFILTQKIEDHNLEENSRELAKYFHKISKELDEKSLEYLSRLQQIQRSAVENREH